MQMQNDKNQFISFLIEANAFKIGEFKFKSGRISPTMFDSGMFNDGESVKKLGHFFATKIKENFGEDNFSIIFGPAYKGIHLSVATAVALNDDFKINKGFCSNRKETKKRGEGTEGEGRIIGQAIKNDDKILMVDDVVTTGGTKYESIELLNQIANNLQFVGLIVAVDRQEIGEGGGDALEEFSQKTGVPVFSIVKIGEIIKHLKQANKISNQDQQRIKNYFQQHGTGEIKKELAVIF